MIPQSHRALIANLDPLQLEFLESRYNIIGSIDTLYFDCGRTDVLINFLTNTRKQQFNANDRYVVFLNDTDFFWHGHGINLNNLLTVWRHYDIPFFTLLIVTNHVGIGSQIKNYCKDLCVHDQPTVIETIVNPISCDPKNYQDIDIDLDCIDTHALCLMGGTGRTHRHATYNALRDLTPHHIAMITPST